MTARRHHTVSQLYLRRFAVPRRKNEYQIEVFDREQRRQFKTSTDNVTVRRHFNTINVEGHSPDAFEKGLARFEGELAPALQRIVEMQSLKNEKDRTLLLNFICLLALRNPRVRENLRSFQEDILKKMAEIALQTPERWERFRAPIANDPTAPTINYEDMKKFVEKGDYRIDMNNEWYIKHEMQMFDTVLPLFFQRGWWLWKASRNSGGFVTSDHPAALMWSDPAQHGGGFHGPGLGMPGTQITFPISPRLAVVGAFEFKDRELEIEDEARIAVLNGATISHAERQVYARDLSFTYMLEPGVVRKASKLIDDRGFLRPDTEKANERGNRTGAKERAE